MLWTRTADDFEGIELHPAAWQKSVALACGGGQQVGYGYELFTRDPSRALLWTGTHDSLVVLTGPDPSRDAMTQSVADGVQAGYVGDAFRRACLWRGTSDTFLDLHPGSPALVGSEAIGTGSGQQVGVVWTDNTLALAALWSGSADSYVNLSPDGFKRSRASRCAKGFQIGWIAREGRGMRMRAVVWNGAADDFLDLQEFLGDPWNVSWAQDLLVDDDRLYVLGTAQQAVSQGRYEMDAGKVPVMWAMKLRIAEPRSDVDSHAIVVRPPAAPAAAESDEQKVDRVAGEFAQAVVDEDFSAAHARLAPWLRRQVTPQRLHRILHAAMIDGVAPGEFSTGGNNSTVDELRAHYREYHKDDDSRTLATTDDFGAWGQPSIYIANEITPANFRQWMWIELAPDPEEEADVDFCLKLWLIVVELEGAMVIGHLEPGE